MASFSKSLRRILTRVDNWFESDPSARGRMILFGVTVIVPPIGMIIVNGPLLRFVFPWKYSVDYELPERVKSTIAEQYKKWLEHENRLEKDAHVKFGCMRDANYLETQSSGSMAVRFGAQIALPFFARFASVEEARDYCKKHLEPLNYRGKFPLCILWESSLGEELLSTFVLSQKALDFLIARDLFANDGYNAFINRPITWATWTAFASVFTYWVHQRFTKGTFLLFAILYTCFLIVTIVASKQWHYLYRHMNSCHSDEMSAKLSFEHSEGGKEYYTNLLKRNRILRNLLGKNADKYISILGDERDAITPYFVRYELLKNIGIEDDELRPVLSGDVL